MESIDIPDTHGVLSDDEKAELEDIFGKFTDAVMSPEADSVDAFFHNEADFFENASQMQQFIFLGLMRKLEVINEGEFTEMLAELDGA